MIKKAFFIFLFVGAVSMVIMSLQYFQYRITGILKGKEVASQLWYICILRLHILCGLFAISIGPFQFIKRLRYKYPRLHKKMGYAYFGSILISGISGLVVAQFAMGGLVSRVGFSFLAIVWLTVTIKAVRAVIRGNLKGHKLYMILSFAMTFTAIPQRTLLLTALYTDISFLDIYRLSAWLPWILNLGIGYLIYSASERKKLQIASYKK